MQTHQKVFWSIFLGFVAVMVVIIMSVGGQQQPKEPRDLVVDEPMTIEEENPAADTTVVQASHSTSSPEVQPQQSDGATSDAMEASPEPETPRRLPPEGPRQAAWDATAIQRVVHDHNAAIQDCYQQMLKSAPSLRGKVIVRITIDPDGYVSRAEILGSSLRNRSVEECVLSKIELWSDFDPVEPAQGSITIRQSYRFGL